MAAAAAAVDSLEEGKPQFIDGNGNLPANYSCLKLNKPSYRDGGKHCTLDAFPLVVKEATFPVEEEHAQDRALGEDVYTISVLPDEGNTSPQCASQFTLLSFIKALLPSKNQMFLDAQLKCQKTQNCINVLLEGSDAYRSCLVDINVEKGSPEAVKSHDEVVGSVKSDSVHMQKVLQRQASLSTDKAVSERCHDAPINRWRKYKRAASFDSRKIVILFSVLSSIGTLILIYLTLKVKQTGDEFSHI